MLCVLNLLFAWRFLGESRERRDAQEATRTRWASMVTIMHVLISLRESAPRLIWMYAIAIGVFQGMLTVLAVFLADTFGVGPNAIWIVYTYFGLLAVVARAGILGWVVDRYGEVTVSRIGLILLAIGLAGFPFMPTYGPLAVVLALVPLGAAFTFPCVTALLLRVIHRGERGVYLGIQQTLGGIGRVVIPLWAGFAYDHLGHRVPFWTSAALVGGILVLGLGIEDLRPRELGLAIPDGGSVAAAGIST
jgi:MFS family permease